ncbi:hypothetical protein BD310DRAFT_850791 [Dichomitus squalens]|uniref:Uncharacterized protein n=1 Tax=Dichomitus squalens TaxID=114155 RepID=A0A4Q9PVI7_9APHY|nr:hypothetical protein BD310DRAFT_850791 [Dichomitus squalens]
MLHQSSPMPRPSKRRREDDIQPSLPQTLSDELVPTLAKHPRVALASDFATFEIGRALDMPALLLQPLATQWNTDAAGAAPPTEPMANEITTAADNQYENSDSVLGNLLELLDLSELQSAAAIETRFSQIASELLHNYRVEIQSSVGTEHLEILEAEFYLWKTGCHEDPFTHASPEQSQRGRWYFHRPPTRGASGELAMATTVTHAGYRGGTRKGVDVTLGRAPPAVASKYFPHKTQASSSGAKLEKSADIVRGGALLRSVKRVSDGKVISGPSLLVDEVLRLSGAKEIAELVTVNWNGDISAFPHSDPTEHPGQLSTSSTPTRISTMYLVRAPMPTPTENNRRSHKSDKDAVVDGKLRIFRSPRIGLDISHPSILLPASKSPSSSVAALNHPRVKFIAQPYRFFVSPYLLTANGRGQTFVGVYDALVARGHCENDKELLGEIVRLTGVKGPTATKYLAELRKGLAEGELTEWVGPKGKIVTSSITAWLRMIGTLRRLTSATSTEQKGDSGSSG